MLSQISVLFKSSQNRKHSSFFSAQLEQERCCTYAIESCHWHYYRQHILISYASICRPSTIDMNWYHDYRPRFEKSSNISLVVSSLVLKLIPKILACLDLSYVIIYTGSPCVISGNPDWILWESTGAGKTELAVSTTFQTHQLRIFKGRMCKHTPFLPLERLYINVRFTGPVDRSNYVMRTGHGQDPLASSCILFQCKHMAKSGITHVCPSLWVWKCFFGFWRVGDNHLIPYIQRDTNRRQRCDFVNGWLDFHNLSGHTRVMKPLLTPNVYYLTISNCRSFL